MPIFNIVPLPPNMVNYCTPNQLHIVALMLLLFKAFKPHNMTSSQAVIGSLTKHELRLTRESKQGNSLFASILVMHLYATLQQDIGLKSPIEEGFKFLGTRVIIVAFTNLISFPDLKKDWTRSINPSQ